MIVRWVRNLEQAANDREAAQRSLDGAAMTPAEQKRAQDQIAKSNREIERFAQRINEELKRAAEKRTPIRYPRNLDSIHDRQLADYLGSVKQTISKLNHQLQVDGAQGDMYARQLESRRKEAAKIQEVAGRNKTILEREDVKLARRKKEVAGRLDQRKTELAKIERRLGEVAKERKKFDHESQRIEEVAAKKKQELEDAERDLAILESQRKHEPNRDRRDQIIERSRKVESQVAELRQKVGSQLKFQIDQLGQIRQRIQGESTDLHAAADKARSDVQILEQELKDIDRARKDMKRNLEKEGDRMAAIDASMDDLKQAQKYAKKYGVVAT